MVPFHKPNQASPLSKTLSTNVITIALFYGYQAVNFEMYLDLNSSGMLSDKRSIDVKKYFRLQTDVDLQGCRSQESFVTCWKAVSNS